MQFNIRDLSLNNIYGRCHTQIYDIYSIKNFLFLLFYVFIFTSFLLMPVCRGHKHTLLFYCIAS